MTTRMANVAEAPRLGESPSAPPGTPSPFAPPAGFPSDAPTTPVPILQGAPAAAAGVDQPLLPTLPTAVPRPPQPAAQPFQHAVPSVAIPAGTSSTVRPGRRRRRKGPLLIVLLLLGGAGGAAYAYREELRERIVGTPEPTAGDPEAPLAFPVPQRTVPEIRTVTMTLEGIGPDAATEIDNGVTYEVTTDFETGASRVLITRPDAVDLEVLTLFDGAVVRRLDSDQWYSTDRGRFPLNDVIEQTRWVQHLDDLLLPEHRNAMEIVEATRSPIGGVTTHRLVVLLDPLLLAARPQAAPGGGPDPSAAPSVVEPGTVPVSGIVPPAQNPADDGRIEIEVWVDTSGVVRRYVNPLGAAPGVVNARALTILSTSPRAWLPDFPADSQVAPMSASALVELGL